MWFCAMIIPVYHTYSQKERYFSAAYEMHHRLQRGLRRFFRHFVVVYSSFRSGPFAFRYSLKPVIPHTPRLAVAGYVVTALKRHPPALS